MNDEPDIDGTESADLGDEDADGLGQAETGEPELQTGRSGVGAGLLKAAALPAVLALATAGAGYLGWQYASSRDALAAETDSVTAAREATIAMLSYTPENAEQELTAARDRLTGNFLDSYTKLINDSVIPSAKAKKVTAAVEVPAAATVSATAKHAVALVFVDQTVTAGTAAPTNTHWSVRITLDKVEGRWLVAGFDPV